MSIYTGPLVLWFMILLHIERSSGTIKTVCDMQIEGKHGPGWPMMIWRRQRDRFKWKLNKVDPSDRDVWRSNVRSAMHEASQLPGRDH